VEHARTVVTEADGIRELARRAIDPETGRLTIGIFPTLGPYLLPHVVPAIRARYPRLELLLVEEKTELVLQRLQEVSLDVGVLAQPVHGRNLHEEPLFEEEFVLAVPAGHPLARAEEPVDTSVLAGHRLLLLDDGHCLRDQALEVCHLSGAGERDDFRATSLETLRQMVNAGVGITLLPELSVRPPVATPTGVRLLRFAEPTPRRRIAMYWRTSSPLGELLTGVAEILRDAPV
jgi:LysR family hydrogen peroxide-inducible transcriptional activator